MWNTYTNSNADSYSYVHPCGQAYSHTKAASESAASSVRKAGWNRRTASSMGGIAISLARGGPAEDGNAVHLKSTVSAAPPKETVAVGAF